MLGPLLRHACGMEYDMIQFRSHH